jgi:branched-chain amino acid transport system substrate-binding protein
MVVAAGPAAEGMYISSPDYSAMASGYADFVAKHNEKYGEAPLSAFHAHAYDGAGILFAAIEKVAVEGEDGTLYVPRGALREAIFATKDFPGITGTLSCTPTGDCGAPIIAVNQISAAEVAGGWPPTAKVWPTE